MIQYKAGMEKNLFFSMSLLLLAFCTIPVYGSNKSNDEKGEEKAEETNKRSNLLALLLVGLLLLTVLIIWFFKVKRIRFVHETGLCLIFGMIAGAILRYSGSGIHGNAVFDPEIFFYVLLPPIIFYAGYDMKKRYFFRNIGAILTYAFIGTIISFIVFAAMVYGFVSAFSTTDEDGTVRTDYPGFRFQDCLLFGSLIAATDPVTILAIFHDLDVEVDLYAIVFGESVMNDAVAIVLYRSIQSYSNVNFTAGSFFEALGIFVGVFLGSFVLGAAMALLTALLTKLTKIGTFPRLETALFTLMSYSTFLIAEAAGLTGIVTVLFCGMVQAHYTFNNLTQASQLLTHEIFGLLNFLSENFIFCYMGLSVFAFEGHKWDGGFICWTFFACAISRACNVYPLSFILNLKRTTPVPFNSQHMLWWGGLRGAVAFALAIRNTASVPRKLMLSSVLVVAIVTVIVNGGLTTWVLTKLGIRVGMTMEPHDTAGASSEPNGTDRAPGDNKLLGGEVVPSGQENPLPHGGRSWVARKWHDFDVNYMKPFFTTRAGPVNVNFPRCFCCHAVNNCCDVQTTSTIADDDPYQSRLDNVTVPSMKRLMTYL